MLTEDEARDFDEESQWRAREVRRVKLRRLEGDPVNGFDIPALRSDSVIDNLRTDTDLTIIAEPGRNVHVIVSSKEGRTRFTVEAEKWADAVESMYVGTILDGWKRLRSDTVSQPTPEENA